MDKTTEDITTLVQPKIKKHYKYIYLDLDILFLNSVVFLLAKSRNISFIHAIFTKSDKQVKNGQKSILLDYKARRFKDTSAFTDGAFKSIIN